MRLPTAAWSHALSRFLNRRALGLVPLVAGATLLTGLPGAAYAASTTGPDYEMPFPCGDRWTGSSRSSHSPSALSIDWNRTNDLGAPMMAAAPGVVTKVADLGTRSYGRYVVVDHGGGRTTVYAHLLNIWTSLGETVDQGTLIGQVGSTGGSTGPHLHFEERLNGNVQTSYFHRTSFKMGSTLTSQSCGDTPVIGDWDGNKAFNIAVVRRGATPSFVLKRPNKPTTTISYGGPGDEAVTGDWNGDGVTDVGVRRPLLKAFLLRQPDGTTTRINFGQPVAVGVTGDWDGNGTTEVGLWNPTARLFSLRLATGNIRRVTLGALGDQPVTGDWNGDQRTDVGVYTARTGTFTLGTLSATGSMTTTKIVWGGSTSLPVAGDWNGDGVGDVGVWDPATAAFALRLTPEPGGAAAVRRPVWGLARG
jgi:murein DD-endopeptidase MepM/ murein hydrolase activator NlpD